MPASEKKRLALRNRLIEVLGEEEAEALMESLPPFDWHKLALKEDIEASEERLRTEMNAEFKMLRAENKEFRGEMALQFARQTRTMVFTILGVSLPTWGAILAMALG